MAFGGEQRGDVCVYTYVFVCLKLQIVMNLIYTIFSIYAHDKV